VTQQKTKKGKKKKKVEPAFIVCHSNATGFQWVFDKPRVPTVGKGAKEQRVGTNVEIRLGDGRKLALLISRDEFPDVRKCSTALKAAGSRLYVDFTMQMTKSELVFDISRYLIAINIAELEGRKKPNLDSKWSRGKAGTFEHTDYLRQKVYHPEHDPRLYSTDSKGLLYNKFFRPSRLSDPFTNDEVLEVSPVHTAVLPSSRKLTPSLKRKKAPEAPESRKGSSAEDGLNQAVRYSLPGTATSPLIDDERRKTMPW
ncbi:hypothetical protein FOZ63_010245, partial [Perkinsus olseni]